MFKLRYDPIKRNFLDENRYFFLILFLSLSFIFTTPLNFASLVYYLAFFILIIPLGKDVLIYLKSLRSKKVEFIDKEKLKSFLKHKEDLVFLGRGFEFTAHHRRLLESLLVFGLENKGARSLGSYDIHNLELFNHKPLYTSSKILSTHNLIFGTTGAGKTRLFDLLISQAILRGDTVIIFDPKNDEDLIYKASSLAKSLNREFLRLDPDNEDCSVLFNPVACFDNISELASRITSLMSGGGSSAAFKSYAYQAITGAVVELRCLNEPITLNNIAKNLSETRCFAKALISYFDNFVKNCPYEDACKFYERLHKLLHSSSDTNKTDEKDSNDGKNKLKNERWDKKKIKSQRN